MAGAVEARSEARMVHIRLDPEVHRRLRIIVAAEDTSMQDWLSHVVGNAVKSSWPVPSTEEGQHERKA